MAKLKSVVMFIRQQGLMELIILGALLFQKRLVKWFYSGEGKTVSLMYRALDKFMSIGLRKPINGRNILFYFTEEEIAKFCDSSDSKHLIEDCYLLVENRLVPGFDYKMNFFVENFFIKDVITGGKYSNELTKDIFFANVREFEGDPRMLWEINRLQYLVMLSQGYVLTRNELFSKKILEIVEQWVEQNPTGRGINWIDAQEVGIRMISLILSRELLISAGLQDDRLKCWTGTIEKHAFFVFSNLSIGRMTHNHFLTELTSLLIFSMTCRDTFEYKFFWFRFSRSLLLREVNKQINSDGMSAEGSTSYTLFDYDAIFLANVFYKKIFNRNLFKKNVFLDMAKIVDQFTVNDKDFAKIGDADCGRYIRLNWHADLSRWGYLGVISHYFEINTGIDFEPDSAELFWIYPKKYGEIRSDNQNKAVPGASRPVMFSESGYLTYKTHNRHLVVRFGPSRMTYGVRFGHTHSDFMSFSLYGNGEAVFCDPGTYSYLGSHSHRKAMRSATNHNSATLDNREFLDIAKFNFGIPELETVSIEPLQMIDQLYLVKVRFYYDEKEYIERAFVFDKDLRFLIILDLAFSRISRSLTKNFLIRGEIDEQKSGSIKIINGSTSIWIRCNTIVGTTFRSKLNKTYYSPRYGVIESIHKYERAVKMNEGKAISLSIIHHGEEPDVSYSDEELLIKTKSGLSVIHLDGN